jgi:manganese/zinc/iron transport system substrate-binding protein
MRIQWLFFGILLVWVAGCTATSADSLPPAARLHIVATTTQAGDLVRILTDGLENDGGVQVTVLMGAGVDPHLYQATEADVQALHSADLIVYSGLNLEGRFDTVFAALRRQGTLVYPLSGPVKAAGMIVAPWDADSATFGSDDPHFWFDPRNMQLASADLAALLAALDPDHADRYRANADRHHANLDLLYAWALEAMQSVPPAQRWLVTSHDAFHYFGTAFGWRVAAIQGISTESEAGVGDIQETVRLVLAHDIPALFVESSMPPNTIRAVLDNIAAQGGHAIPGVRELYSDAMGEPGTPGGTYIGMLAENVHTILETYERAGIPVTIPPLTIDN